MFACPPSIHPSWCTCGWWFPLAHLCSWHSMVCKINLVTKTCPEKSTARSPAFTHKLVPSWTQNCIPNPTWLRSLFCSGQSQQTIFHPYKMPAVFIFNWNVDSSQVYKWVIKRQDKNPYFKLVHETHKRHPAAYFPSREQRCIFIQAANWQRVLLDHKTKHFLLTSKNDLHKHAS